MNATSPIVYSITIHVTNDGNPIVDWSNIPDELVPQILHKIAVGLQDKLDEQKGD